MGIIISPTDYDDWRWGGSAAAPPTSPASLAEINATGIYAWKFANGDSLFFPDQQLPHDYKEGTDLLPHLHWMPTTTDTYTGVWTLEFVDFLDAAPGTALQAKTTLTQTFNSAVTAFQMQTASFSASISGTGRKISTIIHAKLSLVLTSGSACFLNGLDAHYQKDRFGSVQPTSKT